MVGRTKQMRSTPELRSRKKVEWHDMPKSALDAFAQFRQPVNKRFGNKMTGKKMVRNR
jgi:hypothetical protein